MVGENTSVDITHRPDQIDESTARVIEREGERESERESEWVHMQERARDERK